MAARTGWTKRSTPMPGCLVGDRPEPGRRGLAAGTGLLQQPPLDAAFTLRIQTLYAKRIQPCRPAAFVAFVESCSAGWLHLDVRNEFLPSELPWNLSCPAGCPLGCTADQVFTAEGAPISGLQLSTAK